MIKAKNIGLKMEGLLKKYATRIQKDQQTQFPLVEKVQAKNQLKEKLMRDIQGFRTSSSKYQKVDRINPKHLNKILNEVKRKLGY